MTIRNDLRNNKSTLLLAASMILGVSACAGAGEEAGAGEQMGSAAEALATPVTIGSFEAGPNPTSGCFNAITTAFNGTTTGPSWTVGGTGVGLTKYDAATPCGFKPHGGTYSVELVANSGHGALATPLNTVGGGKYAVNFWLAANPSCLALGKELSTTSKSATVGTPAGTTSYPATLGTRADPGWAQKTFSFTAAGTTAVPTTTALTFTDASTITAGCGTAIDDVTVTTLCEPTGIQNGDFELGPTTTSTFVNIPASSGGLAGWTVSSDVELDNGNWNANSGSYSVDLAPVAVGLGAISQSFATVPGLQYTVKFALSGNPNCDPVTKTLNVSAPGSSNSYSVSTSGFTKSNTTTHLGGVLIWTQKSFTFTATATTSTLTFTNTTTTTSCGPVIDTVSVCAVGCQC